MTGPSSRRGFLRGLTTLPLVGGGVALLGAPTAIAEPCTFEMLDRYCALLAHEHRAALAERCVRDAERRIAARIAAGLPYRPEYLAETRARAKADAPMWWFPEVPEVTQLVETAPPSSRAALVMSAVGCEWREVRNGR